MKFKLPLKTSSIFQSAILTLLVFCLAFSLIYPAALSKASASGPLQSYIIKFKSPVNREILKPVAEDVVQRFEFSSSPQFQNIYTFQSTLPLASLRERFGNQAEYLEANRELYQQTEFYNDPGFTLNAEDINKQWGLAKAGFPKAWEITKGSKSNVVAVIDTGIDQTHEDLRQIDYTVGFNILNRQNIPTGTDSDDNGHGTLITGILGATANNGLGIVGTNHQLAVMPIKALNEEGKGEAAAIAEAIVWAADKGANLINLSLGGIGFAHDTTLANAVTYAFNKNIVIIAAAGNDVAAAGGNLDTEPVYPICDDNNANMVIGVTATEFSDQKASFANFGKNCIDVSAPGKRILSTINHDPLTKGAAPNSYAYASGSSLAVPLVTGQAALLLALFPQAKNTQIRDRILATADPIDEINTIQCQGLPCKGMLGTGRINVEKSVAGYSIYSASIIDGDLVKVEGVGAIYHIVAGQKRIVSPFVFNQKYIGKEVKTASILDLNAYSVGPYEAPDDGTLIKLDSSPTVFYMSKGMKLPVTYQIFQHRNFNFKQVNTVSFSEFNGWPAGSFLTPLEGTLVKTAKSKTLYWVIGGTLHPINSSFYQDRGLNVFPVLTISLQDLASYPKGEAYIR